MFFGSERERERERETETETETERQRDRERQRKTETETDRQRDRDRESARTCVRSYTCTYAYGTRKTNKKTGGAAMRSRQGIEYNN